VPRFGRKKRGRTPEQRKRDEERALQRKFGWRPHDWTSVRRSGSPPEGVVPVVEGRGWKCRRCGEVVWRMSQGLATCADAVAANVMES